MNKENGKELKQVIRSQENLRNDTKLKPMKIENMSSKGETTKKKKCNRNSYKEEKNVDKNYEEEYKEEDYVNFEIRN